MHLPTPSRPQLLLFTTFMSLLLRLFSPAEPRHRSAAYGDHEDDPVFKVGARPYPVGTGSIHL